MKKLLRLFLVIVFVLLFVACSPAAQSMAVQLPPELIAVIGMVVMVAITGTFKWLGDKIGQDLSGHAAQAAAAISSVLVLVINYALTLVPAAYDTLLSAFFSFLIVWFGGMGVYSIWKSTLKNVRQ